MFASFCTRSEQQGVHAAGRGKRLSSSTGFARQSALHYKKASRDGDYYHIQEKLLIITKMLFENWRRLVLVRTVAFVAEKDDER